MASSEFSDSSDKGEYANPTTSAEKNSAGVDVVRAHTGATILPDVQEQVPHDIEKGASGAIKGPPPGGFNPRQNPDGGLHAWLCVLGGFCVLFSSFGWINCIGVFQDYYQTHQLKDYSPSTVAWISSMETFFMFSFGPIAGKVYDNYGPRILLLVGTFLHVFGIMMASLSSKYYQFILSQGICSPIGASLVFYSAMGTIPTWFYTKRAFAYGIIAAGSSLGGVIMPIMVQRLIREVDFPWAMRSAGFLILFLMIIANLTVKSRIPPHKRPWNMADFIMPLKETTFDLVAFGSFLFFMGMFLPINYIILEAVSYGMNPNLAQYLVSILNAASLFGRTLPGYIADKIGRYNMMVVMCSFTGILIVAMWIPSKSNAPIITFSALYGFGSGAFVSLAPSLIAQISDVRQIGVRTGTLFAIISIAALISNPIGGSLISRWNGKYTGLQIFGGCSTLVGTFFLTLARCRLAGGIKLSTKV